VRAKSVLNMMMMSFIALAIVPVLWVLYGYSMAFDTDLGNGLLGGFDKVGLQGVTMDSLSGTLPEFVFVGFQVMFAVITVALISGAIADRAKFGAWAVFVAVWVSLVYFPVAHWVFAFDDGNGGWIADRLGCHRLRRWHRGAHQRRCRRPRPGLCARSAGRVQAGPDAAAQRAVRPARRRPPVVRLVRLQRRSAVGANGLAGLAFVNTTVATSAAILGWLLVEVVRDKHATTVGGASGAIAGLVAITPACAAVSPMGAIAVGLVAGVLCALAVGLKYKLGYDDSLDVVGVHLVGGLVGCLLIGLLATDGGLLYGDGLDLLGKQAIAVGAVLAYSFVVTLVIGKLIDLTIGFRVSEEEEVTGIDSAQHLETGYDFTSLSGGVRSLVGAASATSTSAKSREGADA
jgi:Amt family ammonium transporter